MNPALPAGRLRVKPNAFLAHGDVRRFCLCAAIACVGLAIDWKCQVGVVATTAVSDHTLSSKNGVQSIRRHNAKATLAITLLCKCKVGALAHPSIYLVFLRDKCVSVHVAYPMLAHTFLVFCLPSSSSLCGTLQNDSVRIRHGRGGPFAKSHCWTEDKQIFVKAKASKSRERN